MIDNDETTALGNEGQPQDERPETAQEQPEGSGEKGNADAPGTDEAEARVRAEGIFAAALGQSLFGQRQRGVHEIGVQGSVLSATRDMVEAYVKPEIGTLYIGEGEDMIGVEIEVSKDGVRVLDPSEFDAYRANPRFRAGTARMLTLDSFIAHVNRFGDDNSAVFANNDRDKPSLTAVLDYHENGAEGAPRFGRHRTTFAFPLSDEWQAWRALSGKVLKMSDFARFLDDRIIDVLPAHKVDLGEEEQDYLAALGNRAIIADPARLMDLASGLQINEQSVVKEVVNLQDGTGAVVFESVHTDQAGQKLTIPGLFVLGIPVFRGGERYQVLARLRYRKDVGAGIVFWYELWRLDRVFDHAFNEAVDRVQQETDAPVFLGSDEGDCSPGRAGTL